MVAASKAFPARIDERVQVLTLAAAAESPQGVESEGSSMSSDTAFLALMSRLKGQHNHSDPRYTFDEALDALLWAMDIKRRGPAGVDCSSRQSVLRPFVCRICSATVIAVVVLLMLFLTRRSFIELATRQNLILSMGQPSYRGEEPLASFSKMREFRSLDALGSLPTEKLHAIRDVTFVHRGTWRCLRISHVLKYNDLHIWLEAADASGIRLRYGQAYFRDGLLADEEAIELNGEVFPSGANATVSSKVTPTAFWDVVITK